MAPTSASSFGQAMSARYVSFEIDETFVVKTTTVAQKMRKSTWSMMPCLGINVLRCVFVRKPNHPHDLRGHRRITLDLKRLFENV
jgi:hypothetical protein